MKKIVKPWVATLIILIVAFWCIFVPTANSKINQMIFYLSSMNLDMIKEYILSFGIWAPITSFLLMVLQSVIAPIPAF